MPEKELKYYVISLKDVEAYLDEQHQWQLKDILTYIERCRELENKPINEFVCVKDSWPMYAETWDKVLKFADEQETQEWEGGHLPIPGDLLQTQQQSS